MSSSLFKNVVHEILNYGVRPLPEHFSYFQKTIDANGRYGIGPVLKCTSAIRQLAYATTPDSIAGYLQITERTSRECLDNFYKCIWALYDRYISVARRKTWTAGNGREYRLYALGVKNCPKALQGQSKRTRHKYPTVILEAVVDQKLWIWHAFFGVPRANNDLKVLYGSPLFDTEIANMALVFALDEKTLKFKRVEEAARKDIERAFGVLQGCWGILRQPARPLKINSLKKIMYCYIVLHNMIFEDEGFKVNMRDMFLDPTPVNVRNLLERYELHVRKTKEIRDRKVHNDFRENLVEHLWI